MVFESKVLEFKPGPEETVVEGSLTFTVKEEGLTLEKLDAPCTCLTAKIERLGSSKKDKLKWKVGDRGKIVAKVEMKTLRGLIEKDIFLKVVGQKERIKLTVKVEIPELVEISPSSHAWELGETPDSKVFRIKVNHTEPIKIKEHSGREKVFPYEIKTIKDGWEYEISVAPTSTKHAQMGRIALFTDAKLSKYRRYQVFTVVRPKKKAP